MSRNYHRSMQALRKHDRKAQLNIFWYIANNKIMFGTTTLNRDMAISIQDELMPNCTKLVVFSDFDSKDIKLISGWGTGEKWYHMVVGNLIVNVHYENKPEPKYTFTVNKQYGYPDVPGQTFELGNPNKLESIFLAVKGK